MILNFQEQFKQKIIEGTKIHTLRHGERWRADQKMHFYTGSRTKNAKQFAEGIVAYTINGFMKCSSMYPEELYPEDRYRKRRETCHTSFLKMGEYSDRMGVNHEIGIYDELAIRDGFYDENVMLSFFAEHGQFGEYQLVVWKDLRILQ